MTVSLRPTDAALVPTDDAARAALLAAAADVGLDVRGGGLVRVSSRFCFGIEHGDYNGTELFGVGTDRHLWIAWRRRHGGALRLFSGNEPQDGVVAFDARTLPPAEATRALRGWGRFPLGAVQVLRGRGVPIGGLDAVVHGDIPGGGMSRSAALSIALLLVLLADAGAETQARMELAQLAQAIENDHVGSPCGLLDQVMICHARRGAGTHFLPRSGEVRQVPLGGDPEQLRLLCLDTGRTRHGLANATYPLRRRECEQFAARLAPEFGIRWLADVRTPELLAAVLHRHERDEPDACARLRYLYAAQQRLPTMLAAFAAGDLERLGAAFRCDGHDLRDLYRISGPELETMCDLARTVPGVLGERMLGGGDCGTAGAIARPEAVAAVRAAVATGYPRSHPRFAAAYAVHECRTADGIAVLPPL